MQPTNRPSQAQVAPTEESIAARIRKPGPAVSHLAACIYGRGGVGKTTLLSTMPGRGLVLDVPLVEDGTLVLADCADRIDVLQVTAWEEYQAVYKYVRNSNHDYAWMALDTITAAQELAKRKALRERDLSADPYMMSQQDWGKVGILMSELVYRLRELQVTRGLHLIILAQEQLRSGEEGSLEYQPAVSPGALQALIPSLYLVGRLYTRETVDPQTNEVGVERRLRVGPHHRTLTKVRAAPGRNLPPVLRNPSLGAILAYLIGAKGARRPDPAVEEEAVIVA